MLGANGVYLYIVAKQTQLQDSDAQDSPGQPEKHRLRLAQALISRSLLIEKKLDLTECISICDLPEQLHATDTNVQPLLTGLKGVAELYLFENYGHAGACDSAIKHIENALQYVSQEDILYQYLQTHLGRALLARFNSTGNKASLSDALNQS